MTRELNSRLQKLSEFVRIYLLESYQKRSDEDKSNLNRYLSNSDYRWKHTLRVAQFGKVIAENEIADVELVVAACLLHDIAWFDTNAENSREHGRIGAQKKPNQFWKILGITMSKSSLFVMPFPHMLTKIIRRPWKQKFSAMRITWTGSGHIAFCNGALRISIDYEKLATKLADRIDRLEHYRIKTHYSPPPVNNYSQSNLICRSDFLANLLGKKS